jgi:hypothetical protein
VVDTVDEILPTLISAAARVPKHERVGDPEAVRRL